MASTEGNIKAYKMVQLGNEMVQVRGGNHYTIDPLLNPVGFGDCGCSRVLSRAVATGPGQSPLHRLGIGRREGGERGGPYTKRGGGRRTGWARSSPRPEWARDEACVWGGGVDCLAVGTGHMEPGFLLMSRIRGFRILGIRTFRTPDSGFRFPSPSPPFLPRLLYILDSLNPRHWATPA